MHGLQLQYKSFKKSILKREISPTFDDLVSMLIVEEGNLMEESCKKTIESDEELLYSSSRRSCVGTTVIGKCNGTNLSHKTETILSEQVIPLEATKEVEENKVAEEPIITTREGIEEIKGMSKHTVKLNKAYERNRN